MISFIILIAYCLSIALLIFYISIKDNKKREKREKKININKLCSDKFGSDYIFDIKKNMC